FRDGGARRTGPRHRHRCRRSEADLRPLRARRIGPLLRRPGVGALHRRADRAGARRAHLGGERRAREGIELPDRASHPVSRRLTRATTQTMFVLGHLGIGSWLAARRVRADSIAWLLFGAVLPDLIDKPLYYALSFATGRHGAALGLISSTRTFGHTLILAFALYALLPRRIGTALVAWIATPLAPDGLG